SMDQNVERPIEAERDDRLLRQDFVSRLLGALIEPEGRATGIVLGLTGPGGSGKSSILNMVAERAEANHPATTIVTFNPWLAKRRNGRAHCFFSEVEGGAGGRSKKPPPRAGGEIEGPGAGILQIWQTDSPRRRQYLVLRWRGRRGWHRPIAAKSDRRRHLPPH